VRFHVHTSLPHAILSLFPPSSPFPIHIRLLASSPNDGLKQTIVLLRYWVQCIGRVGFVGWRLMETFILYRWNEDEFLKA